MKRDCGSCTVCCTLTYVPELNKPENIKCINCTTGCDIYENRPDSCRKYECAWYTGLLTDDMRPDKSGMMVEVYDKMVAVMLVNKNTPLDSLPIPQLDEFVKEGKPVIATGLFARLPKDMTAVEAKQILVNTVKEFRG